MKIEAGKEYRTRNGDRARIYAVDCGGLFPVHGAIYEAGEWIVNEWDQTGNYDYHGASHGCDLVVEWEKPRASLRAWLVKLSDGVAYPRYCGEGFVPEKEEGVEWIRAPWLDGVAHG